MLRGGWSIAVALVLVVAGGVEARAQSVRGFADNRFEPAGAGSEWRSLESLQFDGHLRPAVALTQNWAFKPLVAYDAQGEEAAALVRHQLVAHLSAAMLLWDRARVDLSLPVPMGQTGTSTDLNGLTYAAPQGYGVGDLRLGADVRLFRVTTGAIRGAVGVQLFLPTGQTQSFSSDGGVRVWPRLLVAGGQGRIEWAARLGVQIRPKSDCRCDLAPGSEMNAAFAVGWRVSPRVLVGPELYGSTGIAGGPFGSNGSTPIEMLLGGQVAIARGWSLNVGAARGLTQGAGSPAVRVLMGVQYAFATGWGAPAPPPPPASPAPEPWGIEPDPAPPAESTAPPAESVPPPAEIAPAPAPEVKP